MRRTLSTALAAAALVGGAAGTSLPAQSTMALVNVHVVDVERGAIDAEQTVVINRGRIAVVGPGDKVRIPSGAVRVDARGGFVIPGLWDMHVHVSSEPDAEQPNALRRAALLGLRYHGSLLLANGVTGVRDAAGNARVLRTMDSLSQLPVGATLGPRMTFTGRKLGAAAAVPGAPFPLRTASDVRQTVTALRRAGASFVKLGTDLSHDVLSRALAECAAQAIRCVAHVPRDVPESWLHHPGIGSYEHLFFLGEYSARIPARELFAMQDEYDAPTWVQRVQYKLRVRSRPGTADSVAIGAHDPAKAARLFGHMAASEISITPTLMLHDLLTRVARTLPAARDTLLMIRTPTGGLRQDNRTPAQRANHERLWSFSQQLVREMHAAGVRLLAGTDMPLRSIPGASLHAELGLLQDAGLSPLDALRTATLNPAVYLGAADSMGAVRAGYVADLVVLRRNPLDDVKHVTSVDLVVTRGRLLRRPQLDSLVEVARQALPNLRLP